MQNLETVKSKLLNIENFIVTRSERIYSDLYFDEKKMKENFT